MGRIYVAFFGPVAGLAAATGPLYSAHTKFGFSSRSAHFLGRSLRGFYLLLIGRSRSIMPRSDSA
jgi:hypothetical protein